MKWISFNDIKPPCGMWVFITDCRGVNIVKWDNFDMHADFDLHGSGGFTPLWDLDYWAPISFFNNEHLPWSSNERLDKKHQDFLLIFKDDKRIQVIKDLTEKLNKMPGEEKSLRVFEKGIRIGDDRSSESYGSKESLIIGDIQRLYKLINNKYWEPGKEDLKMLGIEIKDEMD